MTKNKNFVKLDSVKDKKTNETKVKLSLRDWEIFNIPLFGRGKLQLLNSLEDLFISKDIKIWIATVNPEFIISALKDDKFLNILQNKTTVNVVDGIGLAWAYALGEKSPITNSKLQKIWNGFKVGVEILEGQHREIVITGADLIDDLCAMAERKNMTVYFYGGWENRAQRTADYFVKKYPKLKVAGASAEDFDFKTDVDFLFVCRGMKKQEEWINDNWEKLNCKLAIGLGRTFDYYSGELTRAPAFLRRMGLEWLYSFVTDSGRRWRKLELIRFAGMVLFGRERLQTVPYERED